MAPTADIAPSNYFAAVLAGLWGWLFWNQIRDRWLRLGSALVIAGGLLTIYPAQDNSRRVRAAP